jgi:hypothetical protein
VCVVLLTGLTLAVRADEVIDRVLAVVAGDLITLSDVRAARDLGIVDVGEDTADPIRAILTKLIDRALVLNEVNRYAPPEPTAEAVEQRVVTIERRLGSADALDRTLQAAGLSAVQLRAVIREELRMRAYLAQRFTADTAERAQAAIGDWIEGLRRRAEILDLYEPRPPSSSPVR